MEPYQILIVDDDPSFAKAAQAVLVSHGYRVDMAQDGEAGLARMSQVKPDLVILDVMMAWPLEGVSVSREMMSRSELQGIPIIMATSIRNSEYREAFPQDQYLHIDRWLDKPCSPSQLLEEVQAALLRYERRREDRASSG